MSAKSSELTTSEEYSSIRGWRYIDGILHCDGLSLEELRCHLRQRFDHQGSPAYVYSSSVIKDNVNRYKEAMETLGDRGLLSYSMKANSNPHILSELKSAGVDASTTVSGNEVLLALKCGFSPDNIIFNGNGKQRWEIELAVNQGILLNIDSLFDAHQLTDVTTQLGKRTRALIRLNPAIDAQTHPYLATSLANSKFGVDIEQLDEVLAVTGKALMKRDLSMAKADDQHNLIDIQGVHIHIGSYVSNIQVYIQTMMIAVETIHRIRKSGWPKASIINLGGGLSVEQEKPSTLLHDYVHKDQRLESSDINNGKDVKTSTKTPTPKELVDAVLPHLPVDIKLILEPGRSLVATSGVVMTDIIGVKRNAQKEYIVVDAAMTEVIRPALYGAIHPVSYITPPKQKDCAVYDIVGPVCESGDFLSRQCLLQPPASSMPSSENPRPGSALVVWTTGAYCSSMASNYNLRPCVAEILVKGPDQYEVIRRPQSFIELMQNYF